MKLYEEIHWYKQYEDYKNNLYIVCLYDEVEQWIEKNLIGNYDINADDLYNDTAADYIVIEFENSDDEVRFYLRWKEHYIYWPEMCDINTREFDVPPDISSMITWTKENIGQEYFSWSRFLSIFSFFKEEDAIYFKLRWSGNDE